MEYVWECSENLNELELSTVTREKVDKWTKFPIFPKDLESSKKVRLVYALDYVCNHMEKLSMSSLKKYMDDYNISINNKINLNDEIGADSYTELTKDTILAFVIKYKNFRYDINTCAEAIKEENIKRLIKWEYIDEKYFESVKNLPDKVFYVDDWNMKTSMITTKTEKLAKIYTKVMLFNVIDDLDEIDEDRDLTIVNLKAGTYNIKDLDTYRYCDDVPHLRKITVTKEE